MASNLQIQPAEVLTSKALSIPEEAALLRISDQASMDAVNAFIGERIDPLLKEADEVFDPIITAAHQAHKTALAGKAKVSAPLNAARALLKTMAGNFIHDQNAAVESERRCQQAIADEKARQERIAADNERRRRQEIADREAAERREREVEEAEAQGAPVEIVQAIIDAPLESEPVYVPPPPPAPRITIRPTVELPRNMTATGTWTAEVFDHLALLRSIVDGRQPAALCPPNQMALNAMAKSAKATLNIPGVRSTFTPGITRRNS
jgi:hypothetical protein